MFVTVFSINNEEQLKPTFQIETNYNSMSVDCAISNVLCYTVRLVCNKSLSVTPADTLRALTHR